ncbi:MAG: hypothetical protein WBE38_18670 [Terracidiphilus sp.]
MRTSSLILLAIVLLKIVLLPAAVVAQAVPDNPAPAPPPDPMWSRVEQLVNGQEIVVKPTSGPGLHCRFAGATDAYLFCDRDNVYPGTGGYRFDRAQVVSVQVSHPKANWHPVLLATMAASGIAIGISATGSMDDRGAASAGILSALMVGAIGYPIAVMQDRNAGFGFAIPLPPLQFAGPRRPAFLPHALFR